MKSVSQNLSRLTHQIVAKRVEASLQPGVILALVEDQTHKIVARALDQALQAELAVHLGREPYERADQPTYRNGFKLTRILGYTGWVSLRRPVLRGATPPSSIIPSLKRLGQGLVGFLASRFWLRGTSTRAVAQELNAAFGTKLRPADVSTLTNQLLPQVQDWLNRPVPTDISYLFLDALYLPVRLSRFTAKQAILVALGVSASGQKHVLGFLLGDRESEDSWSALLKDLLARGLDRSKLKLAISDDHKAIATAVENLLAVPHQLCVVHKMRNVRVRIAAKDQKAFMEDFKRVFWAKSREDAYLALGQLQSRWERAYPKAVALTLADPERFLRFMDQPQVLWTTLRSSNLIERFIRELRRRLRPAGAMQAEGEVWKLIWAVGTEQENRWRRVRGSRLLAKAAEQNLAA